MYSKVILSLILVCGAFLPVTGGAPTVTVKPTEISVGEPLVDFTLPDFFTGENYTLSKMQTGKLVMLDFMASWCGPCKEAMPDIKKLYHTFKPSGQFEIFSIDVDDKQGDPDSAVIEFYNTYGVEWPFARDQPGAVNDSKTVWEHYGTGFIPTMYIIYEGKIIYQEVGFAGYNFLKDFIKQYIGSDSINPTINAYKNTQEISIDNPYLNLEVNATDNWEVMKVTSKFVVGEIEESHVLEFNATTSIWTGHIKLPLEAIYNSSEVKVTITALDYFGNIAEKVESFQITHIEDTIPPQIKVKEVVEYFASNTHNLIFVIEVTDNYFVKSVVVIENHNGVEKKYNADKALKDNEYRLKLSYATNINIEEYTFTIEATDLSGLTQSIKVDLSTLIGTNTTNIDDGDTTNQQTSYIQSPVILVFFAMVTLNRRRIFLSNKKYKS